MKCKKKLKRLFDKKIKFITHYSTTKISRYCSNKVPVPLLQKANVIYKLNDVLDAHSFTVHRQNRTLLKFRFLEMLLDLDKKYSTICLIVLVSKKWLVYSGYLIAIMMVQIRQ